jgi:hypothetical protein
MGVRSRLFVPVCLAALTCPVAALAADGTSHPSEVVFIAELVMLMVVGRLIGEGMQRIGQSAVMVCCWAGLCWVHPC